MTVSIKDVARQAGVSIASVSRVISGKPGVGSATEARIRKIMEDLNYRPNLGARGLVKQQTGNIAIIVPRGSFTLNNPFFSTVIDGIAKGIDQSDYNIVMSFSSAQQKKLLENKSVDGIILFSPRSEEFRLEWLENLGLPTVVIGSYIDDSPFPCVRPSDTDGIDQAVHALYERGHRHIGLVNEPMSSMHSVKCWEGYHQALQRLHLGPGSNDMLELNEFDVNASDRSVAAFFRSRPTMTGIVCASDYLAIGIMRIAATMGLSIPEDLSVIGADDVPIASLLTPALSSVQVDLPGIGQEATRMLIDLLTGKHVDSKNLVFPMTYIDRETTRNTEH
ncbi:LacI family DNA-binding transcriptional regulator [Sediminibacillus albus]|uniref:LacI family transcriptional regulator n=1 Tax=Sediminibacillus albus TaxID=407036 RepID=A0A1G9BEY7_9BACI|nr:LacI family DNA-binding transcriptional regulator [Sediminibacillus albus]SDK38088.1 LacI family transcriptional regulator [Sediminibacillus albus]